MIAELTIYIENNDDLAQVIKLLQDTGLKTLTIKKRHAKKKNPKLETKEWAFGIGNLNGQLDRVNLRDFAHEN